MNQKPVNIANINAVAERYGLRLAKVSPYFHWCPTTVDWTVFSLPSNVVACSRITDLPWAGWMDELASIIARIKEAKNGATA